MTAAAGGAPAAYRIDDLARAAGMTVRNVRVYQDRGLLPPPRRAGRVAFYSDAHLARLRLIGALLERGYTFAQITDLVGAIESGRDLGAVLGLEAALTAPWSDEQPELLTAAQLRERFGGQANRRALSRAVAMGLLHRSGSRFVVVSPRLLSAAADLVAAGVPLPVVLDLAADLQRALDGIAERMVATFTAAVLPAPGGGGELDPQALAATIHQVRPHAQRAVDALFAQSMQRRVAQAVAQLSPGLAKDDAAKARG